jgi:hypothetical protein
MASGARDMPTLCQTFRKEAGVMWNQMRTAAKLPLALSEETLTECSLYNIALAHQGTDIAIELQTKRAEGNHGADWEWWLVHGNKGLGFRVQANGSSPTAATKAFLPKNTVQTRTGSSTSSSLHLSAQGSNRFTAFSISPIRKLNSTDQTCASTRIGHRVFGVAHSRSPIK